MKSKYIIRIDDACPTMDRERWLLFEQIFDELSIKPIVAVIPDNRDPKQQLSPDKGDFWETVNRWKEKGWEIALHGYDHVYITQEAGLVPLNQKSEFAGLPLERQEEKIRSGIEIFRNHGLSPRVWVAPSHTFDMNTLEALKKHSSITIISDGISFRPFQRYGFTWLPLQLWKVRRIPMGLYTICYHPSATSLGQIRREGERLRSIANNIVSVDEALKRPCPKYGILDSLFHALFMTLRKSLKLITRK